MAAVPELLQQQEEDRSKLRSVSVDLNVDPSLQIDIPDALSERDKVKFTVHTKTTLPTFQSPEFSVTRQHEDFVWLHDTLIETTDYAGLIIPPAPAKPDFDGPREKMQKLGEGEGSMTKEEFAKMKQELEAEYLAVFKKTVSSHEVFLQRLSSHPVLSKDRNFHIFLEYDQDLSVRRKNTKEMFGGFFKSVVKSADEVLFSGVKEVDDFFEQEKHFLSNYYDRIKGSCAKADRMTSAHKNVADDYIHTAACLHSLALEEPTVIKKFCTARWLSGSKRDQCRYLLKAAELFEKLRKVESRVSSDEDLKLTELLRYYMLNIEAAKDLLYRRTKALIDYENSNKALDKARLKSKDVKLAEAHQQECCQKFEQLSESAKEELINFKRKRVAAFRKNLIEMSELEIKHARISKFTGHPAFLFAKSGTRNAASTAEEEISSWPWRMPCTGLGDPSGEPRAANTVDECVTGPRTGHQTFFLPSLFRCDPAIFASSEPGGRIAERKGLGSYLPTHTRQNILRSVVPVLSIAQISTGVAIVPFLRRTLLANWTLAAVF
ncbi:sorting nexin-5 isoform X3 [Tursiops truncatus]|uniref:sorting nexin-5 isoform X3 n=1 Tax=Tursiops truncatus TaxID=9739 RepID=UPI003CCFAB59